jgi:TatD DNase family protein
VYRKDGSLHTVDLYDLIDTHCHLDLEPMFSEVGDVLREARSSGVSRCVVPGVHPDGWERILMLSRDYDGLYPAFGIHPMHAETGDAATLSRLSRFAGQAVAIGEIGLDPAYETPMDLQEEAFRAQLRIAVDQGLPVLIHCRKVFQRLIRILKEEDAGLVGGIMHAFSGSPEVAAECIRLGFAISLSGSVTWETAVRPLRLARELPLEAIVLETDAPDMTPHPFRGQPNRPALLKETLVAVARIRDAAVADVAAATSATATRILKLPPFA